MWEGLDHSGWATPGEVVLGYIRKQTEQVNQGRRGHKQHPSMVSVSSPASRFQLDFLP